MFTRLEQLNSALVALEQPWRTKMGIFRDPLDLPLVANDGYVNVRYVNELPEVGETETLFFYQGRLHVAVNDFPFMASIVQDFEQVFYTSVLVGPDLFSTLLPRFLGLHIEGPSSIKATTTFTAVLRYATGFGDVVDVLPDAGHQLWTSALGIVEKSGRYPVGTVYSESKDRLMVQVQVSDGTRWATHDLIVEPNAQRIPARLTIYGPNEVKEGGVGQYIAAIEYENGDSDTVSPTWSTSADYATINQNGVLSVGPLQVTTSIGVVAEATVGGAPFRAEAAIVLKRDGPDEQAAPRWIVQEGPGAPLTDGQFNAAVIATHADGRKFNFSSSAWVGQRTWVAVPRSLGVPTIIDPNKPEADEWSAPVIQKFKVDGRDVEHLVLYTMFDNLGQRNWQVI